MDIALAVRDKISRINKDSIFRNAKGTRSNCDSQHSQRCHHLIWLYYRRSAEVDTIGETEMRRINLVFLATVSLWAADPTEIPLWPSSARDLKI